MMFMPLASVFLGLVAEASATQSDVCQAGDSCTRGLSLLQNSIRPSVIHWVADDPAFNEDYTEDDQPGEAYPPGESPMGSAKTPWGASSDPPTLPPNAPTLPPNGTASAVQIQQVAAPAKEAAPEGKAAPEAAKDAAAANQTDAPAAAPEAANDAAAANETAAPVAEANASNVSTPENVTVKCVTRMDSRVSSWLATTSPEDTPCVFGVDPRDEGSHCIFGNGQYGSNGWCWTSADRSTWGSCGDECPLYGAAQQLADKVQTASDKIDKVMDKLDISDSNNEEPAAPAAEAAPAPAAPEAAAKEAPKEAPKEAAKAAPAAAKEPAKAA